MKNHAFRTFQNQIKYIFLHFKPVFCFFNPKHASISGERKIIRLRKQFFSPQILKTASAYRPKTFLKTKSGEAVEARFFSIRHVPVAKRKMSKRQAGHAPNLHSPFRLRQERPFVPAPWHKEGMKRLHVAPDTMHEIRVFPCTSATAHE